MLGEPGKLNVGAYARGSSLSGRGPGLAATAGFGGRRREVPTGARARAGVGPDFGFAPPLGSSGAAPIPLPAAPGLTRSHNEIAPFATQSYPPSLPSPQLLTLYLRSILSTHTMSATQVSVQLDQRPPIVGTEAVSTQEALADLHKLKGKVVLVTGQSDRRLCNLSSCSYRRLIKQSHVVPSRQVRRPASERCTRSGRLRREFLCPLFPGPRVLGSALALIDRSAGPDKRLAVSLTTSVGCISFPFFAVRCCRGAKLAVSDLSSAGVDAVVSEIQSAGG